MGRMTELSDTQPIAPETSSSPVNPVELKATQPIATQTEPGNLVPVVHNKKRRRGPWLTLLGLFALLLIAGLSAFFGYNSGISARKSTEATAVSQRVQEQFQLGLQELADKEYFRARQRFEYVINLKPNYPGVTEKLAESLLALNTTATPTLIPTPTLSPTQDLRSEEELFSAGKQSIANNDWEAAINTLLALRKNDPNYRTVEVDGFLFIALRNRGVDKIIKQADLEGGIYDLTLAKRFGPLDTEASGLLDWSSLYITGASFWEIDWKQAVQYFSQIAPQLPNLRDKSGMTAVERYRQALIGYGDELLGGKDPCNAIDAYQQALAIAPDAKVEESLTQAARQCDGGNSQDDSSPAEPEPTATLQP